MEDAEIISLYWARNEAAIQETATKYGGLCTYVARNILVQKEDIEECVNDTYFAVWQAIPEQRPERFSVFISKITRNLALKRFAYLSAKKRNTDAALSFEELTDCISGKVCVESEMENRRAEQAISDFLWKQTEENRCLFVRRYWYLDSLESLSQQTGFSISKMKSRLFQMRRRLRKYLEKEGVDL